MKPTNHAQETQQDSGMITGVIDRFFQIFLFGKDAAYELLKGSCRNWRKVLISICVKLLSFFNSLTGETREKVLIIDDSPYDQSRSIKVELLAGVFDHAENKFIRGFPRRSGQEILTLKRIQDLTGYSILIARASMDTLTDL